MKEFKKILLQDYSRYHRVPIINRIFLFIFRKSSSVNNKMIYIILGKIINTITGSNIPLNTSIGAGIKFPHLTGIIINESAKIGDNATILHQVTIGKNEDREGCPVIGDNVYIGAGAKVIGKIKIGDNVKIGANAVVVHNIEDNSIVYSNNTIVKK